jgi:hypothetical protein
MYVGQLAEVAQPIIPPDLREKPRRPVNSDVRALWFSALQSQGQLPDTSGTFHRTKGFAAHITHCMAGDLVHLGASVLF